VNVTRNEYVASSLAVDFVAPGGASGSSGKGKEAVVCEDEEGGGGGGGGGKAIKEKGTGSSKEEEEANAAASPPLALLPPLFARFMLACDTNGGSDGTPGGADEEFDNDDDWLGYVLMNVTRTRNGRLFFMPQSAERDEVSGKNGDSGENSDEAAADAAAAAAAADAAAAASRAERNRESRENGPLNKVLPLLRPPIVKAAGPQPHIQLMAFGCVRNCCFEKSKAEYVLGLGLDGASTEGPESTALVVSSHVDAAAEGAGGGEAGEEGRKKVGFVNAYSGVLYRCLCLLCDEQ
jgi:hypothetical protein